MVAFKINDLIDFLKHEWSNLFAFSLQCMDKNSDSFLSKFKIAFFTDCIVCCLKNIPVLFLPSAMTVSCKPPSPNPMTGVPQA